MAVLLNQTTTVKQLIDWCSTHTSLQNYTKIGGQTNEPALSICSSLMQSLLARPMSWKFNRKFLDGTNGAFFVTQYGVQDYRHAGACAFTLQTSGGGSNVNTGGVGLDMAVNPARGGVAGITISGGIATAQTLDPHPFSVGNLVFMSGVKDNIFNSVYSFSPQNHTSGWSGTVTVLTVPDQYHFTFTAPAGTSATITNIAISNNLVTVTAANSFSVGQQVLFAGVGTNTFLNGQLMVISAASPTQFSGTFLHADVGAGADTGSATVASGAPGFGILDPNTRTLTGLPAFGWLESASMQDINSLAFPQPVKPIEAVKLLSPTATTSGNDQMLCMFADENNGVLRFRLSEPMSTYNFQINCTYQGRAPILINLQSVLPWPDDMRYVLNEGALVYAFRFAKGISGEETRDQIQMFQMAMQSALAGEERESNSQGLVPSGPIMR